VTLGRFAVSAPDSLRETARATAEWNAAPAAGKIIGRIAPLLEVMPAPAQVARAAR